MRVPKRHPQETAHTELGNRKFAKDCAKLRVNFHVSQKAEKSIAIWFSKYKHSASRVVGTWLANDRIAMHGNDHQ